MFIKLRNDSCKKETKTTTDILDVCTFMRMCLEKVGKVYTNSLTWITSLAASGEERMRVSNEVFLRELLHGFIIR